MLALTRQCAQDNLHVVDLPYRLCSWALDAPDNVGLWFDAHQCLIAWAVLQTPFWTIDIVCHPSVESELHPEILRWADQRARATLDTPFGHPAWYCMVFSDQSQRIQDLAAAGFSCQADIGEDSWSKALLQRSGETPVKIYRPRSSGFIVRPLAGENDIADYVMLHRTVFETKNMTVEWRLRTLMHPAHRPDLDIVVEAPDGRLAAFCIGWFDDALQAGHVEPLGCHPDFCRYALGRVVLSEELHRLQARGARQIYVETDAYRNTAMRLYESFDFQVMKEVLVYRKDYT